MDIARVHGCWTDAIGPSISKEKDYGIAIQPARQILRRHTMNILNAVGYVRRMRGGSQTHTEKERQLLSDALHTRLATVRHAFEVCKVELPEHFNEDDFGITNIKAMLDELEGPEDEDETQKQGDSSLMRGRR